MASITISANGSATVIVPTGSKIAIFTQGTADILYKTLPSNFPALFYYSSTISGGETILGTFSQDQTILINAGQAPVIYEIGTSPSVSAIIPTLVPVGPSGTFVVGGTAGEHATAINTVSSTIANAGTVTTDQHKGGILLQVASGGAVTCTTATAVELTAAFPDVPVGGSILQFYRGSHASNTATISGGAGVTLGGSGAVVNTGGVFLLIKDSDNAWRLERF